MSGGADRSESEPFRPDSSEGGYGTLAIDGVGLIGGSLALALRQGKYRGKILGVSSESTLAEARELGVIDEGFSYAELGDAVAAADLVVLAGPIAVIM